MKDNVDNCDRYVSFVGISCDLNADKLIAILKKKLSQQQGAPEWHDYFKQKLQQQTKAGHDNLHFIGNQTNTLYEYFEQCQDQQALALLYRIEQECC
ncbi:MULTISPECIES: N(2)-fixation sustaining protein CowN [unclassified Agarivorans]|uniref:N(2)-fixation sustaining protein CowN n=1 Tax=unclassified Agarivorans TaxID=2636026 RepID=UPI003D7C7558